MGLKAIVDKIDDVDEQYRDLYTERNGKFELSVEVGVDGVKSFSDFNNLNEALRKERNDHKTAKDTLSRFGGRSVDDIIKDLDRIPELEASKGQIDEEKLNSIVESRLKGKTGPLERELGEYKTKAEQLGQQVTEFQNRETNRTILDNIRSVATKAKVLPEALEDIQMYIGCFSLTSDGRVVVKDNVGYTPGLTVEQWLTDMQQNRPHWWGATTLGGSRGGQGGAGGSANPWTHENWNMTEQGKIYTQNPAKAKQMAEQAGTTIGGKKPDKK